MSFLQPSIDYLTNIFNDIQGIARTALLDNWDEIILMLQDTQLGKGLDSDGNIIGRYSIATEEWAYNPQYNKGREPRRFKQAGEPYNFEWSGDFFDGMYLNFQDYGFNIFSRDWKMHELKKVYGENIMKLSEENNKTVNDYIILPAIYKKIMEFHKTIQ